jgi:predicted ATPase
LGTHYFYVLLAEACAKANQIADGLAALDNAQAFADQTGEGYWVSEIHRVRGELFLAEGRDTARDRDDSKRAEDCFRTSMMLAQHHNAKSLELRAATSLAGLLQSYGDFDAARTTLEPVYGWFTQGFDTADLIAAKRVMDLLK